MSLTQSKLPALSVRVRRQPHKSEDFNLVPSRADRRPLGEWPETSARQAFLLRNPLPSNNRIAALPKRWDRLRSGLELILDQRGADMVDVLGGASRLLAEHRGFGSRDVDAIWVRGNEIEQARRPFRKPAGWTAPPHR